MQYFCKLIVKAIGCAAVFCLSGFLHADFCQEISKDLEVILEGTEGVSGHFKQVIPFPDQGGSFINQVYLILTDQNEELVLKVENAHWKNEKTLNEVFTLEYLGRCTSIPVPKVLAYENVMLDSSFGQEYILMSRIRGSPFNHEFERIYSNREKYQHVLEQLADILAKLKQTSFSSIGSFQNSGALTFKCPMDFINLGYETSCESFSEYARRWLSYYLNEMKRLKDSGHQNALYFEKYIPYVEQILSSPYLAGLDQDSETFLFSHQDFVMKNILVEGSVVTAVLDWEWSGTAPREFEAKTGCDFLKSEEDRALFGALLEERGVSNFFTPPSLRRQNFYELMGNLYTLIACYEWVEGKLEHSAKFLDQKLEQRRIRALKNFDMQAYAFEISMLLDKQFLNITCEFI